MQQISFDLLPNKSEIDLEQFQVIDIRDAIDAEDEKFKVTVNDKDFLAPKSHTSQLQSEKSLEDQIKVFTEEEILADEAIWEVSEDEEDEKQANRIKLNQEYYQDAEKEALEERVMARYMAEHAPGSIFGKKGFNELHLMTKKERRNYELRQLVLRKTVELAIAKAIRPDLIQTQLHQLVSTVYDAGYSSFESDIISQFIDQQGTLAYRERNGIESEFLHMPRKPSSNNIQTLVKEAYKDSSNTMPILFLISHSVNIQHEVQTFHMQNGMG